jgi:predicted extracellular nuclease
MSASRSFRPCPKALAVLAALHLPVPALAAGKVVISQVYGGGGNSGATYRNDFIELFNSGDAPVSLNGWSVQYASSTGTTWNNRTNLPSVTLQAGQYLLIQEAAGSGGSVALSPDVAGSIAMSATAGKVALASSTTALSGSCPSASVVDFVGYGNGTNCSEGNTPAPAPGNTKADLRRNGGCTDSNHNGNDFVAEAPNPRNANAPLNLCGATGVPTVSLAVSTATASESAATVVTVTATASAAVSGDQTVNLSVSGSGITAGDYTLSNPVITIPSGQTRGSVTFTVVDDGWVEGPETALLTLSTPTAGLALGAIVSQSIAISDNDVPPCAASATPIPQVQGSGITSPNPLTAGYVVCSDSGTSAVVSIDPDASGPAAKRALLVLRNLGCAALASPVHFRF